MHGVQARTQISLQQLACSEFCLSFVYGVCWVNTCGQHGPKCKCIVAVALVEVHALGRGTIYNNWMGIWEDDQG